MRLFPAFSESAHVGASEEFPSRCNATIATSTPDCSIVGSRACIAYDAGQTIAYESRPQRGMGRAILRDGVRFAKLSDLSRSDRRATWPSSSRILIASCAYLVHFARWHADRRCPAVEGKGRGAFSAFDRQIASNAIEGAKATTFSAGSARILGRLKYKLGYLL